MVVYEKERAKIETLFKMVVSPLMRFPLSTQKWWILPNIQLHGYLFCLLNGKSSFAYCVFYIEKGIICAQYQTEGFENFEEFKRAAQLVTGIDGETLDFEIENLRRLQDGKARLFRQEVGKIDTPWGKINKALEQEEAFELLADLRKMNNQILGFAAGFLAGNKEAGQKAFELIQEKKALQIYLQKELEL